MRNGLGSAATPVGWHAPHFNQQMSYDRSGVLINCPHTKKEGSFYCVDQSVQFSRSVVSDSLRPHELQHARPPCPSLTPGPPKPMSIESVMPSNHLILCHPLLLLPPIPPSIRVFSNESVLRIRWPKYWSFSFNISPSNELCGSIAAKKYSNKNTPNLTLAPCPQSWKTLLDPKAGPWIHLQQATGSGCHVRGLSPPEPTCCPPAGSSALWTACAPRQVLWIQILAADPLSPSDATRMALWGLTITSHSDELRLKCSQDRGLRGASRGVWKQMLNADLYPKESESYLFSNSLIFHMRWEGGEMCLSWDCADEWNCRSNRERLLESLYKIHRLKSK